MAPTPVDTSRRSFLKAGLAAAATTQLVDVSNAQAQGVANPMMIVDSHCHATPIWYSDIDALSFEMDRNGVTHAIITQIAGFFDNRYQFDTVAKYPGKFGNVVNADYTKPDAAETLAKLAEQGISGVRIGAGTRSPGADPFAIWKAAAKLGLSISTGGRSANFVSPQFSQIVEAIPEAQIVIEHLGSTDNTKDDPIAIDVFRQIFSLSRYPNTYMKIHGIGEFTKRTPQPNMPFPFDKPIRPLFDMVYDAFGPQRMMWGSDYPVVNSREGYRQALQLTMDQFGSKSDEDRAWIFGKTALKVFPIRL